MVISVEVAEIVSREPKMTQVQVAAVIPVVELVVVVAVALKAILRVSESPGSSKCPKNGDSKAQRAKSAPA